MQGGVSVVASMTKGVDGSANGVADASSLLLLLHLNAFSTYRRIRTVAIMNRTVCGMPV